MRNKIEEYFIFKCEKGLADRKLNDKKEYRDRLAYEIEVISKMGFSGYFLIVADFLDWSRRQGIPTGPGRGSAAGSLVAYCLRITNIDPIPYGLLFERFLNPDRVSMPDIDCDFCEARRDEVIAYVTNKYGADHVAQIGTFGTMKAKGAIKDVARTLGAEISMAERLAKLIPPPEHGKPIPLEKSYQLVPDLKAFHDKPNSPEGIILHWADKLENSIRSYGIHASGVVISPVVLSKILPLCLGKTGNQATQLEMNAIEDIGLIKFDFLGLRTLTLIDTAIKLIEKNHHVEIDIDNLSVDDPKIYEKLADGDTCGIFQLEASSGIRDLLVAMKPTRFEDIAALVAMYRPGPLNSNGLKMYLDVRAGKREPEYAFPVLEDILKSTAGWIIYQEQVMQIARVLAGYTPGLADDLRKAIGKKKEKEMEKHRKLFVAGAVKNGYDEKKASRLYDEIEDFGAYGFNKSHAAAYGYITYQTIYLKTYYPVEFMCAALSCDYEKTEKVIKYIAECRKLGIKVLPPDINSSESGFTVQDKSIRFGLSAIKNLGPEPISHISSVRGTGFSDIIDFSRRVDLSKINKKKLESLVLAGAFDSTGATRTSLLSAIDSIIEHKLEMKKYTAKMLTYDKKILAYQDREKARLFAQENSMKVPASLKEPIKPIEPSVPTVPNLPEMDEQELLSHEKELLGFYISGHPLDAYSHALRDNQLTSVEELVDRNHGSIVQVAAMIDSIQEKTTKKGDLMAFGFLEDKSGKAEIVFFSSIYTKLREVINSGKPLLVKAKLELVGVGDEDDQQVASTSAKLVAFDVTELVKGSIRYEPIEISVEPQYANSLINLLQKYKGNDYQVNISFVIKDGTTFKSKQSVYSIGGNKNAFIRELGRLSRG